MNIYEIVVREPAHLNGGLLDHVYIYKIFLRKKRVNAIVKIIQIAKLISFFFFSSSKILKLSLSLICYIYL